ncbi:molybdopterin converting factor small subunit [Enterococcus rotai]|uniref:ThiS family protein n=2 Tax=Enterococcus TaxID=1350 RepID=R2SVY3_9ENTE|nr:MULTISPECIES: hypothetical protein [Enterococcus]EOH92239.1 hypothetical protein UAW_03224 [Enterococcus haemoperoxidus ATCC BAA-382]EOT61924.1 hypothetical protein I583_00907 [Enterococcus haemoperoxidus ATCC BAA-382]
MMDINYLGKKQSFKISNLGEAINNLKGTDEDFKKAFFDQQEELKWNTVFVVNENVVEKNQIFSKELSEDSEVIVLLQLSGG